MNKLKKILFALAVAVSLGLVGASDAYAQANCPVSAVPVVVRDKGLTELTGNILLGPPGSPCSGVIPAGGIQLTITIQPSVANITNATGTPPTALVVGATNVAPGTLVVGTLSTVAPNTVNFTIPAEAALTSITIGVGTAVAGMTGIRVNVAASGITFPSVVQGFITSSPAGILSLAGNVNTVTIATPQPGLAATFTAGTGIAQCLPRTLTAAATTSFTNSTAAGLPAATIAFGTGGATGAPTAPLATSISRIVASEGYASSFQIAGAGGEGSDATQGTRLLIRLTGLPTNLAVYAQQIILTGTGGGTLAITLVTGTDANGAGGALVAGPVGGTANGIAVTAGTATIVYQVTASTSSVLESVTIAIGMFTFGTPSAGVATASIALAPISTIGVAAALSATAAPIPRFIDFPFTGPVVTVTICQTNILFPYVTNQLGYDVGLAIANTTSDSPVFGTVSQTGTCVYNFYGTNTPAGGTFTTPAFAGGVTDARLLSSMAPGFTGYSIAQCNFQLGHGFFFIVYNLGTSAGVAQGSPALIIPQPVSPATRSSLASTPGGLPGVGAGGPTSFGEGLGH